MEHGQGQGAPRRIYTGGVKTGGVVTESVRIFINEYCHSGNAITAYRAAFPKKAAGAANMTVQRLAREMLARTEVVDAIRKQRDIITAVSGVDIFRVVAAYRHIIFEDGAGFAAKCRSRSDILALTPEERFCIKQIDFKGDDVVRIEFYDKLQALRHLSLLLNFAQQPAFIQSTGINITVSSPSVVSEVNKMIHSVGGKAALKALTAKEGGDEDNGDI